MAKTKTSQTGKHKIESLRPQTTGKETALQRVIAQIEKQYGQGAIMQMDEHKYAKISGIPTGSLSLDIALGGAGIPRGRVTELFGPEASGKTTLALHVIASAQRAGGVAAFIDAEHALDTTWAKKLGVDVSSMLVSQPDTGEQALEIVEMLIRSNSIDVIVVDSVAALTPAIEIEGQMGDRHVGLQARLMSQAMRKLTAVIGKSKTVLLFINQIRMKIGVMFGNPETTPGGRALKFYSTIRIDVRRLATIKEGGTAIGSRVRARVVKNKIAPPFRESEFDLMFDSGISYEGDLLDLGVDCGCVEKSGAWLNYGDVRIGQGRENAKKYLVENKDLCGEIKNKILVAKGLKAES
ncbi:MAG TPA: recombinase RecA [Sedimentisphaerales bacterium]|nr:recombinase RecA [Sedimentisphaerales bacterium]